MTDKDLHIFSDHAIRRFLLGRLNGAEQLQFEQQLFTDPELETRVRLAEFDLTDDYARQRLARADQTHWRDRFLVSTDRRRLYAVSQALRDRYAPASARVEPAIKLPWLRIQSPAWRYAFAALLLLLVLATAWRVTKVRRLARLNPGPVFFKPKPVPTQTPAETNHAKRASVPEHEEPAAALPDHGSAPVVILLDEKNTPQNPAALKLNGAPAHLEGFPAASPEGGYRADIFTITYQPVFSVDWLESSDGKKLELDVPGGVLKPGDYKVKFMHLGKDVSEFTYYFRVE